MAYTMRCSNCCSKLLYAVFTGPFSPYNNLKKLFVDLVSTKV
jgi:hypothetical protein